MVEPGTFVGMRSHSESYEEFFIVEIAYKSIAKEIEKDSHGHIIAKGDPFFCVNYLGKSAKSTVTIIKYTRSKATLCSSMLVKYLLQTLNYLRSGQCLAQNNSHIGIIV